MDQQATQLALLEWVCREHPGVMVCDNADKPVRSDQQFLRWRSGRIPEFTQ